MKVRVFAGSSLGLIPDKGMNPKCRFPMEFHKMGFSLCIDKTESMYAKAFHHTVAARDGPITHNPHDHMGRFGILSNEIPKCIVSTGSLRHFGVWFGFYCVDKIREFNRI